ncbi:MAG: DUF503 domain-containing protein [Deinococcales bacterium]
MANIYLAVYLVKLSSPWVKSLKEKRSLILPVVEKLKSRFPVSVARLDGLNRHDWEMIGLSAISHDRVWLEGMMAKAGEFIRAHSGCEVGEDSLEVELWGDSEELL